MNMQEIRENVKVFDEKLLTLKKELKEHLESLNEFAGDIQEEWDIVSEKINVLENCEYEDFNSEEYEILMEKVDEYSDDLGYIDEVISEVESILKVLSHYA